MEHIWTVVCSNSIVDSQSNNISLINALEQINFKTEGDVEGIPVQLVVVSMWWRSHLNEPEQGLSKIQFRSPEGKILNEVEAEINLADYRRLRHLSQIFGLPFAGSGIYRFEIQLQDDDHWETVASIPLEIIRSPSEE